MSDTPAPSLPDLLALVRAGDIDRLQQLFSDCQRAFERDGDEGALDRALGRYPAHLLSGLSLARRWLERHPASYAAHLVLGECVLTHAYAKRGRSFARYVSAYGMDALQAGLAETYALRLKATTLCERPLHAWLEIGRLYRIDARYGAYNPTYGVPEDWPAKPDEQEVRGGDLPYWYKQAIAMHPGSAAARTTLIAALEPRWGGSMEGIKAFVALPHAELDAAGRAAMEAEALRLEAGVLELTIESWSKDVETTGRMEVLFKTMESLDPSAAYEPLAEFYWCCGRYDDAIRYYTLAIEDHPYDGETLVEFADLLSSWPERQEEARALYQRAADIEHLPAWRRIGDGYRQGSDGYEQDIGRALEHYRHAYAEGDLESGYWIVIHYQQLGDPGYPALWIELAERGHPFAASRVADMYLNGKGELEADLEKGHAHLLQAVHYGSPEGLYLLAYRLLEGTTALAADGGLVAGSGTPSDADTGTALNLLRRSAEFGYARAMGYLGECYRDGTGVEADADAAASWFIASADADPDDTFGYNENAFEAVFEPRRGKPDPAAAASYLKRSAYGPKGYGRFSLAWHLLQGDFAFDVDGELHPHRGKVDERNEAIALDLYDKLAAEGHVNAINNLGAYFESRDPTRAFEHFLRAAELGFAHAQTQVGRCHLQGIGTSKDRQKAIEWLQRAQQNGDENAEHWLAKADSWWRKLLG